MINNPFHGLKIHAIVKSTAPITTIAPAKEQSSHTPRCIPRTALNAACNTVTAITHGNRRQINDAVAPGRINMAITRMAPTDSNALTTTTESHPISA